MSNSLKYQVLKAFKDLHKARKSVFMDDTVALEAARQKINAEYKKYKHVEDSKSIEELVALSRSVENELRTSVIQAREIAPGKYRLKIRDETRKLDNITFNDCTNQ